MAILCVENPKDFTKILLELINEFTKVAEYRFNMQKKKLHFCTISNLKRIIKVIPFTIASKRTKYLGINQGGKRLV